jgi:hypothetical protein
MDITGVTYRGKYIGSLFSEICRNFGLGTGKFEISITEKKGDKGSNFKFYSRFKNSSFYVVERDGEDVGHVCQIKFDKLFFKPQNYKNYNIVIKEMS